MKPIHEFNDFLKKNKLEIFHCSREKNGLNFEIFHFRWKRVSPRENVSLGVCLLYLFEADPFVWKLE